LALIADRFLTTPVRPPTVPGPVVTNVGDRART